MQQTRIRRRTPQRRHDPEHYEQAFDRTPASGVSDEATMMIELIDELIGQAISETCE